MNTENIGNQNSEIVDPVQAAFEKYRAAQWAMIRPISQIKDEVFPQRIRVHRATDSYGGSVEKDYRD